MKKIHTYNASYKHTKSHGPKKYICKECKKGFIFPIGLQEHFKVHTGEDKYSCLHCTHTFTTEQNRDSHEKTHEGCKFACTKCPLTTISQNILKQYIRGCHDPGWTAYVGKSVTGSHNCTSTKTLVQNALTLNKKMRKQRQNWKRNLANKINKHMDY